jgi:hypothetical protein
MNFQNRLQVAWTVITTGFETLLWNAPVMLTHQPSRSLFQRQLVNFDTLDDQKPVDCTEGHTTSHTHPRPFTAAAATALPVR